MQNKIKSLIAIRLLVANSQERLAKDKGDLRDSGKTESDHDMKLSRIFIKIHILG